MFFINVYKHTFIHTYLCQQKLRIPRETCSSLRFMWADVSSIRPEWGINLQGKVCCTGIFSYFAERTKSIRLSSNRPNSQFNLLWLPWLTVAVWWSPDLRQQVNKTGTYSPGKYHISFRFPIKMPLFPLVLLSFFHFFFISLMQLESQLQVKFDQLLDFNNKSIAELERR